MTGSRQAYDSSATGRSNTGYTPMRKAPNTLTVLTTTQQTAKRTTNNNNKTQASAAVAAATTPPTPPQHDTAARMADVFHKNGGTTASPPDRAVVPPASKVTAGRDVEENGTAVSDPCRHQQLYTLGDEEGKRGGEKDEDDGRGEGGGGGGEGGEKGRCRWGPISPNWCQRMRRPVWMLVCLCWAGATQGVVVNGFVNVVISTVERRFELTSTESGVIASCYDIAAVLCLIPLSYFGGRGRKPVYLAVGMFVIGIGSFVFSMPHWTTGLYEVGQSQDSVCHAGANGTVCDAGDEGLSNYKFVFYLGQLLHGAGATPLYTLGTTYLDDNLPVASTSLYQGIFYAFAILGPGIGYLAGGALLNFFTDFDQVDTSELTIDSDNPRWVGAWWLGFLASGTLAVLISVPLFGFPKTLPGAEKYRAEKEKEVYKGKKEKQKEAEKQPLGPRHILSSVRYLVTNPTFMFLNCAAATEGIIVSGFSTFAPKYIEFQFSLTSGVAAQYVGMVAIPTAGGATFLGGWLTKRFAWSIRQILKFCVVTTLVTEFFILIFLVQCSNMPFAGVSTRYGDQPTAGSSGGIVDSVSLDDACNAACGCTMHEYNPVCGRDNVMYYSPCYAGCQNSFGADDKKYSNCSCVQYNFTAEDITKSNLWLVEEGKCDSDCPYLIPFLAVFGITMIGIFVTSMPALSASLRCVPQDQRSFALGIQWIIARCLGSIPGPIIMGKIIDITCEVWQKNCQGDGACFYYDNEAMSYNILGLGLGFNFLSIGFFALALFFYRSVGNDVSLDVTVGDPEPGSGSGPGLGPGPEGIPSHHTSMTTITQPSTPSTEYPTTSKDAADITTPSSSFSQQQQQQQQQQSHRHLQEDGQHEVLQPPAAALPPLRTVSQL